MGYTIGLRYYLRLLGALLLRLPAMLGSRLARKHDPLILSRLGVTRSRIEIPSREKHRRIRVDCYEKSHQSRDFKRYIHLNLHGSGFIIPSLGSDVEFCATVASSGVVVFDADYRKAPEHPFPAAYEDVQDVLSYIQSHGSDFDADRLTASGFSAGGNLALALAVTSPARTFKGVASIYGDVDLTSTFDPPHPNGYFSSVLVPAWLHRFFYACYVPSTQSRDDPRVSPVKAPLANWPEHVLLACGTLDSLYEPARLVVDRLLADGHRDATFLSMAQEGHAFDKDFKEGSSTEIRKDKMYSEIMAMISRAHA